MIEIIIVWQLCKSVGRIVREKGRKAIGWQFMTVGLWLGGEIAGAVVGAVISGGEGASLYVLALVGAAGGGALAYVIAKSLPPLNESVEQEMSDTACESCGEPLEAFVRACPMCGEPVG